VRRYDTPAQPTRLTQQQLESLSLQELRRHVERSTAETELALTHYTELKRSPIGAATDACEAAHAGWRTQYRFRDQLTALVEKRERDAVR
jgi:hypothetical protein